MTRTALRPRWLAWLLVALAAVYVCYRLGAWQLGAARSHGMQDAQRELESRPTVALSQVLAPHAPWDGRVLANRKVTMTGRYDASGQFLVPERYLDGQRGYWVVTPLRTTDPQGVIATVRGWVPRPVVPPAPTGVVTVTGTLAQGESPADATATLPAGQEGSIDLARLVNEWHGDLYNAFAFVATENPDAAVRRVPPPQPDGSLDIRNLAYALQWWAFGLFCPVLWWRMVRSAQQEQQEQQDEGGPDGGGPDDLPDGLDTAPAGAHPTTSRPTPTSGA